MQVDLGESVKLISVVLKPCHDDFNSIGAGFGFPVRFKVEVSDDPTFKTGVVIADRDREGLRRTRVWRPYTAKANGKARRYVRVTATKLAPRQNDFMLALAELEAFDADGKNLAPGKPVTALDSIEAPAALAEDEPHRRVVPARPEARRGRTRSAATEARRAARGARSVRRRSADLATLRNEVTATDAELAKLAGSRRTAYIGTVHTGGGAFAGTGAAGGKPRPFTSSRAAT